jgi:2-polyprenyl-3-methyl-5-hydroxy-6-metoxy-1,4-benzoquinol methylase
MQLTSLETTSIPCHLCGCNEARDVIVNCGLKIVECRECGLVYVNPQPTAAAITEFHRTQSLADHDGWAAWLEHSNKQIEELWSERVNDASRWTSLCATNGHFRLLDVGCGPGDFLHFCQKRGWDASGFEFATSVAELARQRYGFIVPVGDLLELRPGQSSYNMVTMWHVLEHLREPIATLKGCFDVLAPGGVLALEVPNLNCVFRKSYRVPLSSVLHLFHFSTETLKAVVQRAGFEVLECRAGNTGFQHRQRWKVLAKKAVYIYSGIVEQATSRNVSDSIRLYARKPLGPGNSGQV